MFTAPRDLVQPNSSPSNTYERTFPNHDFEQLAVMLVLTSTELLCKTLSHLKHPLGVSYLTFSRSWRVIH